MHHDEKHYDTHVVGIVVVGDLAVGLVEVQVGERHTGVVLARAVIAGAAGSRPGAAVSRHVVDNRVNVDAAHGNT